MITSIAIGELRLHPAAERVPMADAGDLAALRSSLAENGQQDPIDATEAGVILDGRTRWKLLTELGADTVQVRVVHVPEDQQTHYIVDRALARRHLTLAQKRALNDLLAVQVIEERPTKRGNVMRIGYGQTERAAKLGVDLSTVKEWDHVGGNPPTRREADAPTHAIDKRGRPQPIHKAQPQGAERVTASQRRAPAPTRHGPPWSRHFTKWCRAVLPEDRPYIVQMSDELHKALALLGLSCENKGEI